MWLYYISGTLRIGMTFNFIRDVDKCTEWWCFVTTFVQNNISSLCMIRLVVYRCHSGWRMKLITATIPLRLLQGKIRNATTLAVLVRLCSYVMYVGLYVCMYTPEYWRDVCESWRINYWRGCDTAKSIFFTHFCLEIVRFLFIFELWGFIYYRQSNKESYIRRAFSYRTNSQKI